MNRIARKARTTAAAGGIGLLLFVAGLGLAPSALADDGPQQDQVSLSAPAPAEVGLGGLPVAYADTVANTGTTATDELEMHFTIDGGMGLPPNAASLEYRTDGGTWQQVPLAYGASVFSGTLPGTFTLEPGASRTVHLRIGLPMGTAHDGDSNGGTQSLKLHTTVARSAAGAVAATDDHVIAVDGLSSSLSGVPASVTAGGPGVTFTAKVGNPTASAYDNVTQVLLTDAQAIVEVRRSGHWARLTPSTEASEPGTAIYAVNGTDFSMGAHAATVAEMRLSYGRSAGGHSVELGNCALVNAGSHPLSGVTSCGERATITVKAAGSSGGSATPTPSASASASAPPASTSATGGAGTSTQLAETGGDGTSTMAVGAGALLLAGAATVGATAHRRRSHR